MSGEPRCLYFLLLFVGRGWAGFPARTFLVPPLEKEAPDLALGGAAALAGAAGAGRAFALGVGLGAAGFPAFTFFVPPEENSPRRLKPPDEAAGFGFGFGVGAGAGVAGAGAAGAGVAGCCLDSTRSDLP